MTCLTNSFKKLNMAHIPTSKALKLNKFTRIRDTKKEIFS